jgi:phosphoribosylaminoimidazolecarboxamide formyltransferase/IMP cyclohydrolase
VSERTPVPGQRPVRRALIGVSDKSGLLELATGLHAAGVEIVSTGGTAKVIADAGVPVTPVEEVTGFPESFDGRVKTLHPRVHAGLLADTTREDHVEQLRSLDIAPFDLLVVNLYPFASTVASGATPEECVENIDIGGPAMVRAAAKNHASVAVVVDPSRYDWVLQRVREGGFGLAERKRLAAEAYAHTAAYDVAVASWFASSYAPADEVDTTEGATAVEFPDFLGSTWREPAPAGRAVPRFHAERARPRRAAARQGDVVQQLRRHRRGAPCGVRLLRTRRGDHQARQSVWHRRGRGRRRGAPQGTCL